MRRLRAALPAVLPAVILCGCVLLSRPFAEIGFNDDFSYIWSARVLAQTGHIAYNGWGAMMLGWQLYLGALFLKIFGFSFSAVRASVFLVALATSWLMQRVLARCGIGAWNSAFATLTLTLCPVYLPLAFSFMSDIPAFFCVLLCFYCCLRALQAAEDGVALAWLCAAAVTNDLGGTVRQTGWLGALIMVPCAAWLMRRRRGALATGAALWIVSALFVLGCMHLYHQQPYTFNEPLRSGFPVPVRHDLHTLLATTLCALPLLTAYLVRYRSEKASWRSTALASVGLLAVIAAFGASRDRLSWLAPFSIDSMSVTGIDIPETMLGSRPAVIPAAWSYALTAFFLAAVFAVLICALDGRRPKTSSASRYQVSDWGLFLLLGPMSMVYLILITTRQAIFDRYGVPLLFVLVVALLRLYERKVASSLPAWSVAVLLAMASFSVASLHDLWATSRARLQAANEMVHDGIARSQIAGGAEYDGWTELQLAGFIDNPRLHGALHPLPPASACQPWYLGWMPGIHPAYALAYEKLPCLQLSQFPAVEYRTWLAPRTRAIYILSVPKTVETQLQPDARGPNPVSR